MQFIVDWIIYLIFRDLLILFNKLIVFYSSNYLYIFEPVEIINLNSIFVLRTAFDLCNIKRFQSDSH
jgi:hypothetical protein